jgi:predicted MFS family arabinose efflux permease
MGTKAFWAIVLAFFLVMSAQITFMIHVVSFLTPTLGHERAAASISLMTGVSICARLIVGTFVDRVDKRFVSLACFLLQGAALFIIAFFNEGIIMYLCLAIFGGTMGNILMTQTLIIGECFGMVSFGKISGLAMLFTNCGSSLGPMIGGILYDMTQSYHLCFMLFSLVYLLASGIIMGARPK